MGMGVTTSADISFQTVNTGTLNCGKVYFPLLKGQATCSGCNAVSTLRATSAGQVVRENGWMDGRKNGWMMTFGWMDEWMDVE